MEIKIFTYEKKIDGGFFGVIEIEPPACEILKTDDGKYTNAVLFSFPTHEEVENHTKKNIARILKFVHAWGDSCMILGPTPQSMCYYQIMFFEGEEIRMDLVKKILENVDKIL